MDRLEPLDALFIEAEDEDENTSMAIASIAVVEGPAPSQEEVLALVAARLPLVPRYRQKIRTVPFHLGRPVWVDDPDFDLTYHIRRAALPQPGGDQQLAELMARVMSDRLDRDHPLWEYWVVEGLARDRWALISKVHHCMVDGIGGADLYRLLTDFSLEPAQDESAPDPVTDETAAPSSAASLIADAVADLVELPARQARVLKAAAADPGRAMRQAVGVARAVARFSPNVWPAAPSSLSGNIGKERRYAWARASLDDVKMIKREFGGTVNDVVLAAISSGFRALLLERGEQPQPHEVPSLVPVSVRAPGDAVGFGNYVSATVADLPIHIAEPVQRLGAVRTELDSLKASNEAVIGQTLAALGRYSPYVLASWLVRRAFSRHQREIVTVTTNVMGPPEPLYWMGRRLEAIIPYVPIATTVRTGISIFSYAGTIMFGVTADYTANPDVDVLARGIEHGISELLLAAERHAAAAASTGAGAQPAENGPQPAGNGPQPAENGPKPETDSKPAETDSKPAENGPKPAEKDSKPAEKDSKPAEKDSKPAKNDSKPAKNGSRHAKNGSRPAKKTAAAAG